jgi:ABC-type uncharacterized transport system permease subunit
MSNLLLYLAAFVAYGVLAVLYWRAQMSGDADELNRGALGHAIAVPLALHGYLLYGALLGDGELSLGLVSSLSLILWLTVLVYWLARFFYQLAGLQMLVLPLAAAGVVLPALFPPSHALSQHASLAFSAHVFMAMLAYSMFTIAALHAGLMSLVEKRLHHAALPPLLKAVPPLLTMEILLFRIIGTGFVMLTLTLISGMVFSEEIFGKPWQFNHMTVLGAVSWAVFAVLLVGHYFYGWRGRTAVRWTMSGFVFLILAYLGTQFVLEVLLRR